MMEQLPEDKLLILYDAQCRLCNRWVKLLLLHDPKDHFRFIGQQSDMGKQLLAYIGYPASTLDSIVVYHPKVAYYVKTEAVLHICKHGDMPLQLLQLFRVFPKPLLNLFYHWVARNRYTWFGKDQSCCWTNLEYAHKFLT